MDSAFPTTREEELNKLYDKGWVSAAHFIKVAHGGEMPKGLKIVNPPDFNINIKNAASDPLFYLMTAAYAIRDNWGKIGLAWFLFQNWRVAAGILGFTTLMYMFAVRGYVRPTLDPENIHINDLTAAKRYFNKASEGLANVIAHEGWHSVQGHDGKVSLSSPIDEKRAGLHLIFPKKMSKWLQYLSSEAEIGARMFTVLSNAYIQHGEYPQNKYELWTCLMSQGMEAPQSVLAIMHENLECPECAAAMQKYPKILEYVEKHADKAAARQLNQLTDGVDDEQTRFNVWTKVFTGVYGDIIEVIGDQLGQVRMGHTHNIHLREIFMKAADDHMHPADKKVKQPDHDKHAYERMTEVAAMMRKEDAQALMRLVVSGFPYKELAEKHILIPSGITRLLAVFALARHPELAGEADRILYATTRMSPEAWKNWMISASKPNPLAKLLQRARSHKPQESRLEISL